MHADIERLIALQQIDSSVRDAEQKLGAEAARIKALESRLTGATSKVATAKERIAQNAVARRDIEKDVTLHQGRLSKFREQGMNVKTNQEYHAIQHEIAFAQNEIKAHEDRMLERMMELDELNIALKTAEADLASTQKDVEAEKASIVTEHDVLRERVDALTTERAAVVASLSAEALGIFERVSGRRNGIAMSEAKDGVCTLCHVRLRPQVFNTVRRNESILQCDHCNRILYFVPPAAVVPAS
jgi:predicted  nucleic acid-binding Zn-ribbon protein